MAEVSPSGRTRPVLKSLGLMLVGALLLGGGLLGAAWLDGGRFFSAALGRDTLARTCTDSLVRQLSDQGFEPADVEFGEAPEIALPWVRDRRYGSRFTFVDGAEQVRIDGVMACLVSGGAVTVEFRVGSTPHRVG